MLRNAKTFVKLEIEAGYSTKILTFYKTLLRFKSNRIQKVTSQKDVMDSEF